MEKLSTKKLALCGIIAALYVALTLMTASFAYGPIQFRIADALCVLPFFVPYTTIGLFVGCLVANLFSTVSALDIIIGSAATLVGCLMASRVKNKWLVPVPTILSNAIMVGAMLSYVYTPTAFLEGFVISALQVGLGELAVLYLLGIPLINYIEKSHILSRLGEKSVDI